MNWEQFRDLYLLILRNQSSFFREVYNGRPFNEIDLQAHLQENEDSMKMCFQVYDSDGSGYLNFNELKEMLRDLNLHKQFAKHYHPEKAFEGFCWGMWQNFDKNSDGRISYDEFVQVHNTIMDR